MEYEKEREKMLNYIEVKQEKIKKNKKHILEILNLTIVLFASSYMLFTVGYVIVMISANHFGKSNLCPIIIVGLFFTFAVLFADLVGCMGGYSKNGK